MRADSYKKHLFGWIIATFSAILAAFVLDMAGANATTAGMVLLALVVWSATHAIRWVSLYLAVLCACLFDYYFLPPFRNLQLASWSEWIALIVFVVCCLIVSRVAEVARSQTRYAEQRREDAERLYALSQEMMLHEDASGLIREIPHLLDSIFTLSGVVLFVSELEQTFATAVDVPAELQAGLKNVANSSLSGQENIDGFTAMPLMLGMRAIGSLGWREQHLSSEVASAMCAQVAIALARAMAIEATTRIEAAREGERLRTALIDSLTHELRTPLTSIRIAATTLQQLEKPEDAGSRDLIAIVDEESARLDTLIGEVVEMAQIDANVLRVDPKPCHVWAFLDEAVEELHGALAKHKVSISTDRSAMDTGSADTEAGLVWFDPALIGRVLRHLLENAACYTPAGSLVTLSSWHTADWLEFSVADNGPGIEPSDLPMIFEKFYRGKRRISGKGKGSGMGLAIARAIVTAHGGGMEAANLPERGAIFRFWIPLVVKEPKAGV